MALITEPTLRHAARRTWRSELQSGNHERGQPLTLIDDPRFKVPLSTNGHACRNAIIVHQEDDLVMYVGADRSGSPLEVGVVAEGKRFKIIHAMPARAKYLR